MSEYFDTCSCCKHVKMEEWGEFAEPGVIMFPEHNYICSNPESPYYEACVIGSWGCIFSSKLSPMIKMADGRTLEDYRKANCWHEG